MQCFDVDVFAHWYEATATRTGLGIFLYDLFILHPCFVLLWANVSQLAQNYVSKNKSVLVTISFCTEMISRDVFLTWITHFLDDFQKIHKQSYSITAVRHSSLCNILLSQLWILCWWHFNWQIIGTSSSTWLTLEELFMCFSCFTLHVSYVVLCCMLKCSKGSYRLSLSEVLNSKECMLWTLVEKNKINSE